MKDSECFNPNWNVSVSIKQQRIFRLQCGNCLPFETNWYEYLSVWNKLVCFKFSIQTNLEFLILTGIIPECINTLRVAYPNWHIYKRPKRISPSSFKILARALSYHCREHTLYEEPLFVQKYRYSLLDWSKRSVKFFRPCRFKMRQIFVTLWQMINFIGCYR